MPSNHVYQLPQLPYPYDGLEPQLSEQQLTTHHQKHHQAYVNGANNLLAKLAQARSSNSDFDCKALLKELSFQVGGYLLHSLFWENLAPAGQTTDQPQGGLKQLLDQEFGDFNQFKKEFNQTAMSVEGSGWVALTICPESKRPILMQIEKHNQNIYPTFAIVMVLDMFEHAYYIDYKNDKAKYLEAFWQIINWQAINNRLEKLF